MVLRDNSFESEYNRWFGEHVTKREGERKRRLQEGHGHAEREMIKQIWWPGFGGFQYLHPEYEVTDFLDGRRFIDFAYIRPPFKIAFEIDGYGPHLRDISRIQFSNQWVRQMHLINDNWIVVRISYDDVINRPHLWQQLIQQMIGRLFGDSLGNSSKSDIIDKEIIRMAIRLGRSIKLSDVEALLKCGYRASRSVMNRLEVQKMFVPDGGGQNRTHTWRLALQHNQILQMML